MILKAITIYNRRRTGLMSMFRSIEERFTGFSSRSCITVEQCEYFHQMDFEKTRNLLVKIEELDKEFSQINLRTIWIFPIYNRINAKKFIEKWEKSEVGWK